MFKKNRRSLVIQQSPRPHSGSYEVVWEFERKVAEFVGAKYGVATDSCTSALFLCCKYHRVGPVVLPVQTYISVPAAVIHAGGTVIFKEYPWEGSYRLDPYPIWDSALKLERDMYSGGLVCLSFQAKKPIPIGRGGMVVTDDLDAVKWLRKARANGRDTTVPYDEDFIDVLGWNMAMIPEQASRGLQLLERFDGGTKHQFYPDLRRMPVFRS